MNRAAIKRVAEAHTRKQAAEGEAPKVYLHQSGGGDYWLWTSFSGYGTANHLIQPIQTWDKKLFGLFMELQKDLESGDAWAGGTGLGTTFFCPKSNPRVMVANYGFRVGVNTRSIGSDEVDQAMEGFSLRSRIPFKQMPH